MAAIACAALAVVSRPVSAQSSVEITSPANGSLFRPGQTVYIKVRTHKKYDDIDVIADSSLQVRGIVSETDPLEYAFPLPPDLPAGLYQFRAIGYSATGLGPSDVSDDLEIDVEPIWPASADGSRAVRDDPGVTVDAGGIPLRHRSAIAYPPNALEQGIEGTVVAEVTPDSEGHVQGVHVLSGPVTLSRYVIHALTLWHYAEGVGKTKARRVTIAFHLADAKLGRSTGHLRQTELIDNLPYAFWVSGNANVRDHKLKQIRILGLSEDEAAKLRARYEHYRIHEGDEVSARDLTSFRNVGDSDLYVYFFREGREISVTVAPAGYLPGVEERPPFWNRPHPIETEKITPDTNLDYPIWVSAADQARKLISKVDPDYPGNSNWDYVQGTFPVDFTVGRDGQVTGAKASCPFILQRIAEEAVKQWKYQPTIVKGRAVEVKSVVYLDFYLPY